MKPLDSFPSGRRLLSCALASSEGAALIITLILVTILLILPLAFFIQSARQREISNASTATALTASVAEGAIESILSNLEQEISSTNSSQPRIVRVTNYASVSPITNVNLVYYPIGGSNMMPTLAGSSASNGLENLLKRSARGVSNFVGDVSLAVASSTTNPSVNGYSIAIARWNRHLLLARAATNSATDFTPTNSFTPPDWIVVTTATTQNPTNWSNSFTLSSANTNSVRARYAYAIYDEGGLLDANVAGYPTSLSSTVASAKNGPFFADLTQIGLNTNQINALVGWRDYISGQVSGNFPSYSFSDAGVSYASAVLGCLNGFMAVNPSTSSSNTTRTDHQFATRQQLISFVMKSDPANAPAAMNALRYLGNYDFSLNQPSFAPSFSRPKVGVNDDTINPGFLNIEVNQFPYANNVGVQIPVGTPLVKKRFPLNSLCWITYAGPISTVYAATNTNSAYASLINFYTNAGIPLSLIKNGTATNIALYYGLTWTSNSANSGYWTYRAGSNQPIMTLPQIASLSITRDPDFFELLKATLTYGSLGKAYSTKTNISIPEGYNNAYDKWTDAQIIQIGANIIDQFDPDSYPTRIQFSDGNTLKGATVEIRGVEDLPYLYQVREGKVMITDSSPSVTALPWTNTSLAAIGSGGILQEPEIWNPHAMRSLTNTNAGPNSFRLLAVTTDPLTIGTTNYPTNGIKNYVIRPTWITQNFTIINGAGITTNLNITNSQLTFTIPTNNQGLFREPTLLMKPNIPTGSRLAGSSTYTLGPTNLITSAYQFGAVGVADGLNYIGIPMGIVPMAFTNSLAVGDIYTNGTMNFPTAMTTGIVPTGYVTYTTNGTAGFPAVTYLLQCQDAGSNWITYDEKYTYIANATNGYGVPNTGTNTNANIFKYNKNKSFFTDQLQSNWSKNAIGSEWSVVAIDPRSSRFGMLFAGCNGGSNAVSAIPLGAALSGGGLTNNTPLYAQGWAAPIGTTTNAAAMQNAANQNAVLSMRPDDYAGMTLSSLGAGPAASGWVPTGTNGVIQPGMLVQNNPNMTKLSSARRFSGDTNGPATYTNQYFADNDGVVRRGMSAFVPYSSSIPVTVPSLSSNYPSGMPLQPAYQFDLYGNVTAITNFRANNVNEFLSRPIMLNHPFRSPADLGVVFSGTPWRSLDCSTPESGGAALLDVFCINDTSDSLGLVEGKVNLNTRLALVLQAILAGAYKEDFNIANPSNNTINSLVNSPMLTNLASAMANAITNRTYGGSASGGPFKNIGALVGRWYSSNTISGINLINGSSSFVGFSDDQSSSVTNNLTAVLSTSVATDPEIRIQRIRDTTIRTLAASCQTRVWNLLVDLFVQYGYYPTTATGFNNFVVQGELHYWVHLSIDRFTGQLLNRRVETVKEN